MRLQLKAHCECDDIIRIGRVVENEVAEVEFDFSQWQEEYGAGIATLLVLRNHDANPYPVVLTIEDGKAVWTITDADTAVFGRGCFQLKYVAGTKVKMSKIFQFTCGKSLTGEGDAPDPYEDWLDTLTDLTAETQTNAQAAQASAESAQASAKAAQQSAEEAEEIRQSIVDNRSDWNENTTASLKYVENRPAVRAGTGISAVVEGQVNSGTGKVSASGWYAHAEGYASSASGYYAHAENQGTASGRASHAEGNGEASGRLSHAEGTGTASGETSHAEGSGTQAKGNGSHAEGGQTEVLTATNYAHVEGYGTKAWQSYQHVQGKFNSMGLPMDGSLVPCHVVGCGTDDTHRKNCHTLDFDGNAWYRGNVRISGEPTRDDHLVTKAWVEGKGYLTEQAQADWAENDDTAPNYIQNKPEIRAGEGPGSIIEGAVDGSLSGMYSHTEGWQDTAATGPGSHAEGAGVIAAGVNQHAQGKFNVEDINDTYAHIVGNGTGRDNRSNAHTLDWSGNAWYAGKVSADGTPTNDNDLVPKSYADKFLNAFPVDTASGSVASFSDGAELPLKSLTVNIDPVQDLHGYDSPWPAGGGANLWGGTKMVNDIRTAIPGSSDVDYTTGRVAISAGAEMAGITLTNGVNFKENTQYTFIIGTNSENPGNIMFAYSDGTTDRDLNKVFVVGANVSASGKTVIGLVGRYYSGTLRMPFEASGLFEGVLTADQFSPYSNICPISGWDEAMVVTAGANLLPESIPDNIITGTTSNGKIASAGNAKIFAIPVPKNTTLHIQKKSDDRNSCSIFLLDTGTPQIGDSYYKYQGFTNIFDHTLTTDDHCWLGIGTASLAHVEGLFNTREFMVSVGNVRKDYAAPGTVNINIPFGETVFGGTLDILTGVLTVNKIIQDLGELNWTYRTDTTVPIFQAYFSTYSESVSSSAKANAICSCYAVETFTNVSRSGHDKTFAISTDRRRVYVQDSAYTDATAFKTAMDGVQMCYKIAEPIEITLDPHDLESLYGNNTIYADTGDTSVEYRADPTMYIGKKIAQAISALT